MSKFWCYGYSQTQMFVKNGKNRHVKNRPSIWRERFDKDFYGNSYLAVILPFNVRNIYQRTGFTQSQQYFQRRSAAKFDFVSTKEKA